MAQLSARKVSTAKAGKYSDGGNLYLIVSRSGSRKWVLRFTWRGKPKEMGLGGANTVSLAEAREKAFQARQRISRGINPISERRRNNGIPSFGTMADSLWETLSAGFRSEVHKAQWKRSIEVYALQLRAKPIDTINTDDVLEVLKPIWVEKAETASRVRGRIEKVLDAAKARGYRFDQNPARWRGHLDHLLPRPSRIQRAHYAAMPYEEVSSFIGKLRHRETNTALALEYLILCAARTGEVLGARWHEIDFNQRIWNLPPERMKSGRAHRVPLSENAVFILKKLADRRLSEFVFPGRDYDAPLSQTAMEMMLRRMKIDDTVHGFRSSFRDWAGNVTNFQREIIETALAHVVGDQAEQAYRRSDALEKRRTLMEAWAAYCEPKGSNNVVQMHKRKTL
jgi:integrase